MDFHFTEEQQLFRRTVREFAQKELLPEYAYWDKTDEIPTRTLRRMGELGLTGLLIPEKYGGSATDFVTVGIAVEECAKADFNLTYFVMDTAGSGHMLARFANEDLKEEWLPRIARGDVHLGVSATEPHAGSDLAALRTRAVRDGDAWVITGEKSSTSVVWGDGFIVWTTMDPALGSRGVCAFVVPSGAQGLGVSKFRDLGTHALWRGALHLDHVRVAARNIVGEEGQGLKVAMEAFDFNRAIIALMCIGAAQQTLEETVRYAQTRTAFGQAIARFQGVAFPLVEAATYLEAARLLSYKVLWLADHKLPHKKEGAMCKSWIPRMAVEVIHQCLLLHGHAGYSDDYPIGQRMRDVIGLEIGDGTPEIMKIVIAREIFGREFNPS